MRGTDETALGREIVRFAVDPFPPGINVRTAVDPFPGNREGVNYVKETGV